MKKTATANSLNVNVFNELYFNTSPVVQKGFLNGTDKFELWSLDYLKSKIGSKVVTVKFSSTGVYNYAVPGQVKTITGAFDEMANFFKSDTDDSKSYYLQQYSIGEHFPELLEGLPKPGLNVATDHTDTINLWVGGAGCVTPLHCDRSQNFLLQIRGRKEILFFSPKDSAHLYPIGGNSHISEIDLDNVDHERFPLFRQAVPYFCLLEPGDVLYIPPKWWHQVRSLDMSISINYWWNRFDVVEGVGMEFLSVDQLCDRIKLFVEKGLGVDHKDKNGELLLLKAIRNGYTNVVEAFLKMGADPNSRSYHFRPGMSALSLAREYSNSAVVELLIKYGSKED